MTSASLSFGTKQDLMCPQGFGFVRAKLFFLTFLGDIASLLVLNLSFSQCKQRRPQAPGRPRPPVSREAVHLSAPSSLRVSSVKQPLSAGRVLGAEPLLRQFLGSLHLRVRVGTRGTGQGARSWWHRTHPHPASCGGRRPGAASLAGYGGGRAAGGM